MRNAAGTQGLDAYRPSGRFDPLALVGIAAVLVVAAATAWLYQRLVDWIPFIYVNVFLTAGFGLVLGAALAAALRWGKVRSRLLALVAAAAVALVAEGASFHWAYRNALPDAYGELRQLAAAAGEEAIPYDEFERVFTFDDWREARVESGWTLGRVGRSGGGGLELSGVFVYAVWLVELGILLVITLLLGAAVPRDPFCETCDRWTETKKLDLWPQVDTATLRRAVEAGDRTTLLAPRPAPGSGDTATYVLRSCPACRQGGFVGVSVSREERSAKNKVETKTEVVAPPFAVSSAERDALAAYRYPEPAASETKEPPSHG
jgi:hypothetical protein